MDAQYLSHRVEALRERVSRLFKSLREPTVEPQETLEQSFIELVSALEELQTAEEELKQQVEELSITTTELERERQRYLDLFNFSNDGYLITNLDGVIQELNPAASMLLRRPMRSLIHKPLVVSIDDADRRFFRSQINQVVRYGEKRRFEVRFKDHTSAAGKTMRVTLAPDYNDCGQVIALRWAIRDVSREKHIDQDRRENQNRFQAIFQHAGLGILLLDRQGSILESNGAFQRIAGYTLEELQTLPLWNLIGQENLESFSTCYEALFRETQQKCRMIVRVLNKDGQVSWVRMSVIRHQSQKRSEELALCVVEDVTELHETAEELRALKKRQVEISEDEAINLSRQNFHQLVNELANAAEQLERVTQVSDNHHHVSEVRDILLRALSTLNHNGAAEAEEPADPGNSAN